MNRKPIFVLTGIIVLVCSTHYLSAQADSLSLPAWDPIVVQDTLEEVTVEERPPVRIMPWGTVRLKRLCRKRFPITGYGMNDTIRVRIQTNDAVNLRKACLRDDSLPPCSSGYGKPLLDTTYVISEKDTLSSKDILRELLVEVKAPIQLRRARAEVNIEIHPYVKPDTIKSWYELEVQPNPNDSLQNDTSYVRIQANGQELDTIPGQQKYINKAGQIIAQQDWDSVMVKTYPPEALAAFEQVRIKQLGRSCWRYTDFARGDTLFIQVESEKKPIQRLWLFDDQGNLLNSALQQMSFADTLVITDQKKIELCLRGSLGWARKHVSINVLRQPPSEMDTVVYRTESVAQYDTTTVYDTLMLSLLDMQASIAPTLNIEAQPKQAFEVRVPLFTVDQGHFMFLSYWFGLDYESVANYQTLNEEVPPEWAQPGVPVAVAAYGLGHPVNLPISRNQELQYFLANPGQTTRWRRDESFSRLHRFDNSRERYGILYRGLLDSGEKLTDPITGYELRRFFVAFENTSAITTYPLDVKMVGYYRHLVSSTRELRVVSTRTFPRP